MRSDLAHFMNWDKTEYQQVQRSLFVDLNDYEQSVVHLLRDQEYISIDRFYQELKLSPSVVAGILLELEFKGMIKSLPGKKYMLIR
jgi:DNA processing protein